MERELNYLMVEGVFSKKPVISEPLPGFRKSNFTLEAKRFFHKLEETVYFNCEAYGNNVNLLEKAKPGNHAKLVGRLKQNRWKDGSGINCSKVYIAVEKLSILELSKNYKKEKEINTEEIGR